MQNNNIKDRPEAQSPAGKSTNQQPTPDISEGGKPSDHLLYYTLNTGHIYKSPRSQVSDEIIQLLTPVVEHGGSIPFPGVMGSLKISHINGGAMFTILQDQNLLVHCACAWAEEAEQVLWQNMQPIHQLIYRGSPGFKPAIKPAQLPWLSVILFPDFYAADAAALLCADLDRCIAWAILEHPQRPVPGYAAKLLKQSCETVIIQPQNGETFTLEELKSYVGGSIQIVQSESMKGVILVINANAKSTPGLVKNELASRIWQNGCVPGNPRGQDDIVGNAVLCHTSQMP